MCNFSAYFSHDNLSKYLIIVVYYKTLDFQSYNAIELNIGETLRWIEQNKMRLWKIIPWDMYINMAASRLLILTYYTHMEIFLKEAGIISTDVNVTFKEYEEVIQYDPDDASNELGINENWKPQNQITID